tara:strand:+ start:342 stop:539 length:198 start_codon:yes stop_codon:yes gene_type:complete
MCWSIWFVFIELTLDWLRRPAVDCRFEDHLDVLVGDRHRGIHLIAMDKDGNHYGAANALDLTKHI